MEKVTARSYEGPNGQWTSEYPNTISRLNGYRENAITYVPVAIIGGGESGIAMGCRLKERLGFDQFRIFDRQSGIGGTWWINRYPGVACDVPALFYSFSFCPNYKWTALYPTGPEICQYMNNVCNQYQIIDKIQLNTDVEGAHWLEDEQIWEVKLRYMAPGAGDLSTKERNRRIEEHGIESVYLGRETIRAKVVVSCVGGLVEPNDPPKNVPGFDTFKGEIFHSARWRYDVDFHDKNVVVLGTGCSAAQFVPRLTKEPFNAKSVVQLMRSPPWVVPRLVPPGGDEWWGKWSPTFFTYVPGLGRLARTLIFLGAEHDWRLFGMTDYNEQERRKYEKKLLRSMQRKVPSKYHEILTPDYGVGCKRRIFDAAWLPGLQDEKIDLSTQPLREVREHSVIIGPGQTYPAQGPDVATDAREVPADVIVLANGFETTTWFHPLKVTGRHGADLVETMEARGGPQAYLGTAMDGFPNFFAIFGPNTATGHSSVIMASENMVEHSLNFIAKLLNGDATTVEVKRSAEEAYTREIQAACKKTVFNSGGCNNWYVHGDWNATVYPYSQVDFGYRCMFPKWSDWNIAYTAKGALKRRFAQLVKALLFAAAIVLPYKAHQSGEGLDYFRNLFLQYSLRAMQYVKGRT